ncbi:MAG: hypothetical protein KF842_00020 [Caulobacter sp.]|nr:hypothetical protein [Caulobacter sp.]
MTAPAEAYRVLMRALVQELKKKYSVGAKPGDPFSVGTNRTLYSVLNHIEELAYECGIPREEIDLHLLPDPSMGAHD